ncbi:MAG: hypothetical protein WA667_12760 [Candidatus Nitrosopolaris sp.]
MTGACDKEAFVGLPGRTCWYTGDAEHGLRIQLSAEDVLAITAEQIRAIFAALGAHNPLDQECRGFQRNQLHEPLARRLAKRLRPASRGSPTEAYARLVSPRFWSWLGENSVAVFGRTLTEEQAVCIQAVFGGEGLLPMNGAVPEDFPTADVATATQSLVGRTVIYEEGRRFVAAKVSRVDADVGRGYLTLGFENLEQPGFSEEFPKSFTAGGEMAALSVSAGALASGMGLWHIVTGPGTVRELLSIAAGKRDPHAFVKEHRRLVYGG